MLSPVLPLLRRWTTSKEQGLLVGLAFAGCALANAATYPMAGLMCNYSGWRSIFYYAGKKSLNSAADGLSRYILETSCLFNMILVDRRLWHLVECCGFLFDL